MWYLLILVIFSYAAFERFYRVTEIGLYGSDVFFYYETAKKYLAGDFIATEHFRPLAYSIYALAMKVGGVNFYSIKVLNGVLDLLNILVILLLSVKLLRNRWWALVPTAMYVLLTEPALQARTELLHVPSTLPLLLCCLLMTFVFDFWRQPRSNYFLFAAGLCFGLSTNLHPSLNLLGPLFALTIFVFILCRTNEARELWRAICRTAIFTSGFITVYFFTFALIGFQNGWQAFSGNRSSQSGGQLSLIENLMWSFQSFVSGNSSFVIAAIIYVLLAVWLWKRRPQRHHFFYTMSLILCVGYAVLYSILVPKFQLVRTFLPLMPLLLITTTAAIKDLIPDKKWKIATGLALVFICALSLRPERRFWPLSVYDPVSITFAVYGNIQDQLQPEDKLLILPLVAYGDRKPFSQPSYFGPQAQYVIESPALNVKELLNPSTRRWIILLKDGLDFRIPADYQYSRKEFEKQLVKYLALSPDQYDAKLEADLWRKQILLNGYQPATESERFEIFKRSEK